MRCECSGVTVMLNNVTINSNTRSMFTVSTSELAVLTSGSSTSEPRKFGPPTGNVFD